MSLFPVVSLPPASPAADKTTKISSSAAADDGDDYGFGLGFDLDGSQSSRRSFSSNEQAPAETVFVPPPPPSLSPATSWSKKMMGGALPRRSSLAKLKNLMSSSSSKKDIDDMDAGLDDSRSRTSLDLVEKVLCEQQGGGEAAATAETSASRLRKSTSMPEMEDFFAMRDFDAAVCALKEAVPSSSRDTEDATSSLDDDDDEKTSQDDHGDDAPSSSVMTAEAPRRASITVLRQQQPLLAGSGRMRRSQSFAGFTGLAQQARGALGGGGGGGFSPAFHSIEEGVPIKWKPHDPHAVPKRTSLKGRRNSVTSAASTASFASSACSVESDDIEEGSNTESSAAMQRSVSFSSLEIFEHEVTLGDNPSVSAGPPVTLAWCPHTYESHDVDEYEEARSDLRRDKSQMRLPDSVRFFQLMRERGFTASQIQRAVDEVQRTKKKRRETVSGLRAARMEEALESAERKAKRFFKAGGKRSNKI